MLNVIEEITVFDRFLCWVGLCEVINRRPIKGHLMLRFYVKFNLKFRKMDSATKMQFVLATLSVFFMVSLIGLEISC